MVTVTTEAELAKAMKDDEPTIEIIGDLANKTIKLKATGSVSWAIAFAALGAAVALAMTGVGVPAALGVATASVVAIGTGATTTAIALGVAAGGTAILSALRDDYEVVEKKSNRVVLKRR